MKSRSVDCDKKDRLQKAVTASQLEHSVCSAIPKKPADFHQSAVDLSYLRTGMYRESFWLSVFFKKKGHPESKLCTWPEMSCRGRREPNLSEFQGFVPFCCYTMIFINHSEPDCVSNMAAWSVPPLQTMTWTVFL